MNETLSTQRPPDLPRRPDFRPRQGPIVWGIVLIAMGLLMLGDQLEFVTTSWGLPFGIRLNPGRLWPLILIAIGAARLFMSRREGRPASGFWLLFLGGLFLLHTYDVLTLRQSWPLFIVAGGLSIIFGDRAGRGRRC